MCKKKIKISYFLLLILFVFAITSCGDTKVESPLLPEEIELIAVLENNDGICTQRISDRARIRTKTSTN